MSTLLRMGFSGICRLHGGHRRRARRFGSMFTPRIPVPRLTYGIGYGELG